MRKVADMHPDPKVQKEYQEKAEKFEKASPRKRRGQMNGLLKGLGILLASPFLLAGAAIFVAGSILYGVGSLIKGLGDLATGHLWENGLPDDNDNEQASSGSESRIHQD